MNKDLSKKSNTANSNSHDPLNQYMREIGKIKLLTKEEEKKLAEAIKEGDPRAVQEWFAETSNM